MSFESFIVQRTGGKVFCLHFMNEEKITVVAGSVGCGKTTWIRQQLALRQKAFPKSDKKVLYFNPSTRNVPIDQKLIALDCPGVQVFTETQQSEFLRELESAEAAYIELGCNLGLGTIEQILDDRPYYPVAILPPLTKRSKWHSWAKEILTGSTVDTSVSQTPVWRVATTGKVFSEASLEKFWDEIIQEKNGKVTRFKGLFHIVDSCILYVDFAAGVPFINVLELNLPLNSQCKLRHFTGIEIVGLSLNKVGLQKTLENSYFFKYLNSA
jgi:G3E family GTPase